MLRIDERGQRVVFDEDQFGGVDSAGSGFGDDDRDDLADVPHDVRGEQRPRPALVQPRPADRREGADAEVGGGEDLHAFGGGRIDPGDARVRIR